MPAITVVCVLLVVGGVASYVVRGAPVQEVFDAWVFQNAPVGLICVVLFGSALRRQPDNRAAWFFYVGGIFGSLHVAAMGLAYARGAQLPAVWSGLVDGTLAVRHVPGPLHAPLWIAVSIWVLAAGLPMTLGLLHFPDGRLPSPSWRPVTWLAGVGLLVGSAAYLWAYRPWSPEALAINEPPLHEAVPRALFLVGVPTLGLASVLTVASLVVRVRRAAPEERRRVRPVVVTGSLLVAVMVLLYPWQALWAAATVPAVALFLVTIAASVARYRLFDVEVVVSRAVATTVLGIAVTLTYIGIVASLGGRLGAAGNVWSSVAATAVIAVGFEPVRRRVVAAATRLVLGARATPYEVLSALAERLARAGSTEDVLDRVVHLLVDATAAARAEVRSCSEDGMRLAAARGGPVDLPATRSAPVVNAGELLGEVRLLAAGEERFLPSDERLLQEVAATLGPVLHNVRLTRQLRDHIEELRTSRHRLVAAHDEARRTLERDIHDGTQQQLLSLRIKLGLAATLAERDGTSRTAGVIDEAAADADAAIRQLRDLARGLYPPALADHGLEAALRARARTLSVPVTVHTRGLARYDRSVESAVYFCCLEALQNASKHADPTSLRIDLVGSDEHVRFTVTDDGAGFDPTEVTDGTGLTNMRDRLTSLGGDLEVSSSPGSGTVVRGHVPYATAGRASQLAVSER